MASGFRRSLTRNGGRTIVALVALVVVGAGGWNPSGPARSSVAATEASARELARSAPAASPVSVVPGSPNADLAALGVANDEAGASAEAAAANAGLQPSIQYEEAEKHAADRIDFKSGGRVTVGFEPRAADRWPVGGVKPGALPSGRLDGASMRRQGKKPDAHPAAPAGPVDVPTETEPATPATSASFIDSDTAPSATPDAVVSSGGLRREIFGFLPYWQINSSTLRLDYSKISTIAYFGVGADAAGNLQKKNADGTTTVGWSGWTSSKMTSIISTAHTNRTRVVLTVQSFGWNTSGLDRQKALLGSSTARLNLARQIAAAVRDRGADGVNLDFEPLASTYDAEFTALVRSVRAELDKVHAGYQLTFDTTGSIGNYPIENATAPGGADAIFIMGYDYRSSASSPVGSIAPLRRTGYDIVETVAAYAARVAPSKLILGVPYYGRAWSTSTDAVHGTNTSSTKTGASTTVVYSTAADYLTQYGRRLEATEQVAWTAYQRENCTTTYGCVTSWRQLYIDDAATLGAKYDLVNSYNLRGAGIWALGYDGTRPELWGAIESKFVTDTVPPTVTSASVSTSAFSPNFDGALDTVAVKLTASGATGWSFSAAPVSGTTVGRAIATTSGSGSTASVVWDGRASGAEAPEGSYRLTLAVADAAGNWVNRSWTVRLDRTAPVIAPTAARSAFSPNGDRAADTARLAWTSSEPVNGNARIYRGTTLIRAWGIVNAASGAVTWTGTVSAGTAVPDGTYTWRVSGRDGAGTLTTRTTPIVVDRTLSTLRWSRGAFYPQDGDGLFATSRVTFNLKRSSSVSLAIYSGSTLIRTVWTKRTTAAGTWGWTWNGRNNAGALVARGSYQARVTATNGLGTSVLARTVLVDAYRIVRSATALSAGQTLTLTLTATEALRASPTVSLTQPGRSAVTRTATSLGSGRYRVTFTIAAGAAGSATIKVSGRDSANGLNWSTTAVTIR